MSDSKNSMNKSKKSKSYKAKEPTSDKAQSQLDSNEDYTSWAIGTESIPPLTPRTKKEQSIPAAKRYLETKKKKNLTPDISTDDTEENINANTNNPDQIYDFSSLPHLSPANAALEKETVVGTTDQLKRNTKQLKPTKQQRPTLKPTPSPKNVKNLQPKWITNYQRVNVKFKMVNLNKAKLYEILHPHFVTNKINHVIETPHGLSGKFQSEALIELNTKTNEISIHNIHKNDLLEFVNLAQELKIIEPTANDEIYPEELAPSSPQEEKEGLQEQLKLAEEVAEDLKEAYTATQMIPGF